MFKGLEKAAVLASLFLFACGSDNRAQDAGADVRDGTAGDVVPGMDGSADGSGAVDCTGRPDGTDCSETHADGGRIRNICLAGVCTPSSCGDGFVDTMAGEQCDDGNLVARDGCEPGTCRFSCTMASDCDDMDPCNGTETCDTAMHRCAAGTPPIAPTACVRAGDGDAGVAGVCRGGACVTAGCGNGVVEAGEECDDMNMADGDGCDSDCTFTCESDAECSDGDLCNGAETCNTSAHRCVGGTAPNCDDGNACTMDSCVPATGCSNVLIDRDADGHAPSTLGACGDDCDDTRPTVFTGATEFCDMIDNDCDMVVDDSAVMATCFPDADGDGYPTNTGGMMACQCPMGFIPARPDGKVDCYDGSALVFPGQREFFTQPYCTSRVFLSGGSRCIASSWDYDCSRAEDRQYTTISRGCGTSCTGSGWDAATVTSVPACGATADYRSCLSLCTRIGGCSCSSRVGSRVQGCH